MLDNMQKHLNSFINIFEKFILILIMALTMGAVLLELKAIFENMDIVLADLLLLFIYVEVISMVAVFLNSRQVPVIYPIFIAITALSRLIILQGKDMDPLNIYYEAVSIFLLALSVAFLQTDLVNNLLKKFQNEPKRDADQQGRSG